MSTLERDHLTLKTEFDALKIEHQETVNRFVALSKQVFTTESQVVEQEQYSRRANIRVFGLKEEPGEDVTKLILGLIKDKLGIVLVKENIAAAHRLPAREGQIRPINIVRFSTRAHKEQVIKPDEL